MRGELQLPFNLIGLAARLQCGLAAIGGSRL